MLSTGPEDISTLRAKGHSTFRSTRSRLPLPRSPLFHSHDSGSPGEWPTYNRTQHVASYGSPGLFLLHPARRPRSYRNRTISYSFEESERASATYEDIQQSDDESNSSLPRPMDQRSLHDELRGSSLQSASAVSHTPSSPPESTHSQKSMSSSYLAELVSEDRRVFYFSSPRLLCRHLFLQCLEALP